MAMTAVYFNGVLESFIRRTIGTKAPRITARCCTRRAICWLFDRSVHRPSTEWPL